MPDTFFETHGDELFVNVFRVTIYIFGHIFGEPLPEGKQESPESLVNLSVHNLLAKIMTVKKDEASSKKLLLSLGEIIYDADK
jgi:hypothetical protein